MKRYGNLAGRIKSRLLTDLSGVTGLSLSKPTYICAKMTMRCNSRCMHCDIWKTEYGELELTTGQWFETLDALRRWLGKFSMVFTGGEALLRPDMDEILKHAVGLGINAELLTNGLMVDDRLAKRIVSTGISQVTLSFDGIKAETHDRFRGNSGFHERTKAAVLALARHGKSLNPGMKVLLKTVISRNNLPELVEIARFAGANGIHVRYQPIEQNYGEAEDPRWYRKSALWIDDVPMLKAQVKILKELKASGAPIDNPADELDSYVGYFEHPDEMMAAVKAHDIRRWNRSCRAALGSFVLSSNGDVRMCYMMEPVGNVARSAPGDIWRRRERCWKKPCHHRQ